MTGIRLLALATAANAFYLLIAGAQVNTHQAALSVPDWPLSYGQLLASKWPGNVFYEQHHRAAAGTTLVLFLVLLVALWRRSDLFRARHMARYAAAALAIQILLGGIIVLALNPPWIGVIHVVLAIATSVLISAVAILVRPPDPDVPKDIVKLVSEKRICRQVKIGLWLVFLQVLLGSLSRHPPAGESMFVASLLAHVVNGLVVTGWLVFVSVSLVHRSTSRPSRTWGWLLLTATVVQLGVAGWVFAISPEPLVEAWPPPVGFPMAHAAHIALAGFIATCLAAVLVRSRAGVSVASIPRGA